MSKVVPPLVIVGAIMLAIAGAVVSTLHAQARGLAMTPGGDLDVASLSRVHAFVAAGGEVRGVLPNGLIVRNRRGQSEHIIFAPRAVFLQNNVAVGKDSIEPRAHVSVLGLPATSSFIAYKVRISPHHHAIGGRIDHVYGSVLEIATSRFGAFLVRMQPGTVVTLRRRPAHRPLIVGMHVATLAVPDPRQPAVSYLAEVVRILPAPVTVRVGGSITQINTARNTIAIYSKSKERSYTVEVKPATKITLHNWPSGYGDMALGDHITVSGYLDTGTPGPGPHPIIARRIRISSPNFGGVITAMAPAGQGALILTVRARRGHILRIEAPGRATVIYGVQPARVLDLQIGEKIAARGKRTDKFALTATFLHIYPHQRTVGGAVASVLPGTYRIANGFDNTQYIVHTNSRTAVTLNGRPTTARTITMGVHIRVRGYDALHNDQKSIPVIIATHITVIARHAPPTRHSTTLLTAGAEATVLGGSTAQERRRAA